MVAKITAVATLGTGSYQLAIDVEQTRGIATGNMTMKIFQIGCFDGRKNGPEIEWEHVYCVM